jgi:hypothetical protein
MPSGLTEEEALRLVLQDTATPPPLYNPWFLHLHHQRGLLNLLRRSGLPHHSRRDQRMFCRFPTSCGWYRSSSWSTATTRTSRPKRFWFFFLFYYVNYVFMLKNAKLKINASCRWSHPDANELTVDFDHLDRRKRMQGRRHFRRHKMGRQTQDPNARTYRKDSN